MIKILDQNDVNELYFRAEQSFLRTVTGHEKETLAKEVNMPLNQIVVIKKSIRVEFEFGKDGNYVVETRLNLFSPAKDELGYYCLHQDQSGDDIDDYLVFN